MWIVGPFVGLALTGGLAVGASSAKPVNTSLPTISGTAEQQQVLTADPGAWSGTGPFSYEYQWRRCDSAGSNCSNIKEATATTYAVAAADVGHTLRVRVTATGSSGRGTATSAPTAVVPASASAPVNASPPTISGTPQEGQALLAQPGSWSGTEPISYAYQWQRCGAVGGCGDILAATEGTYTPTSLDVGFALRVRVTATNVVGSAEASSAQTAVVVEAGGSAPANSSPPAIAGAAQAGQTLTADPGTWSGAAPLSYGYAWRRCDGDGESCTAIAGATARSYSLGSSDIGSTLRVTVTASNPEGSSTASSTATAIVVAAGSVGYRGPSTSGAGLAPTGSKPESKLWWNDGAWWASMWAGSGQGFHIFRLDRTSQRWIDAGVALDDRSGTRADVLWDGTHLYVLSHVFSTCGCSTSASGYPSRLYRFSYDAARRTYTADTGFPVQINNTRSETLVLDKDSTGILWATWAQDRRVMVSHSQGDDRTWTTPYVLPATGASTLTSDDISSVVAFGGNRTGVMWSNQNDSAIYFAHHLDGAPDSSWTSEAAVKSSLYADDHLNLKSLQADGDGNVYAVSKTSLNDAAAPDSSAPLILLLTRRSATGWTPTTAWRVADRVTRPLLLIDDSNSVLHLFATSSESGGSILEKSSPTSSVSFSTGLGSPFLKDAASNALNNATAAKQALTRGTGLVVLASNDAAAYYWHNDRALP